MYKDDIFLVANNQSNKKELAKIWEEEINNLETYVQHRKNKRMVQNSKRRNQGNRVLEINYKNLETVTTYEQLGRILTQDGKIDLEINYRIKNNKNIQNLMT